MRAVVAQGPSGRRQPGHAAADHRDVQHVPAVVLFAEHPFPCRQFEQGQVFGEPCFERR
jgi:hypothetical protein